MEVARRKCGGGSDGVGESKTIEIRYRRDDGQDTNELVQVPFPPVPGDLIRMNGTDYEVVGRRIDVDYQRAVFFLEEIP